MWGELALASALKQPQSFPTPDGALLHRVRELVYTHRHPKRLHLPQTTSSQPHLELEALTNAGCVPLSRRFWVSEVWVQVPGGQVIQAHELHEL